MKYYFKQWKRKRRLSPWIKILLYQTLIVGLFCESALGQCEVPIYIESSNASSGFLHSPNYPTSYPEDQNCQYILIGTPDLVIHLTFIDFDLEDSFAISQQCLNDYVLIIVTDRNGRRHYGERYCGNKLPSPIKTMQYKAEIMFTSSRMGHKRGFKIRYDFIGEADIQQPQSAIYDASPQIKRECGGKNDEDHLTGSIQSPGFPAFYPKNATCFWLIRVPANRRIYIRLTYLDITTNIAECEKASLYLSDGYKHDGLSEIGNKKFMSQQLEVKFCGNELYYAEEGMMSYLSQGNRVIIKFVTKEKPSVEQFNKYESEGKPIGFKLRWTEVLSLVEEGDNERRCEGFTCSGGEFCIDDGQNVCAKRERLCINETLVCNGYGNCAEADFSDLENCYSDQIIIVSISSFVVILILIAVGIVCQINKRKKEVIKRVADIRNKNENLMTLNPDSMKMTMLVRNEDMQNGSNLSRSHSKNSLKYKPQPPQRCLPTTSFSRQNNLAERESFFPKYENNTIWQRRIEPENEDIYNYKIPMINTKPVDV